MKCPRCGKLMTRDSQHIFCTHCGYLDDGKQIYGQANNLASDLEIFLGKDYDNIVSNNNYKQVFWLGPFYLFVKGFLLIGFLIQILEIYLWYLIVDFFGIIYFIFIGFIFTRAISVVAYNPLCLVLYHIKLKFIKRKNPTTYLEKLRKSNHNTFSGLGVFIFFFCLIILLIWFLILYFDK